MATIGEMKKELRYREWAEEIAECQSSGMAVKDWCRMKGLSSNTYYRRLRVLSIFLPGVARWQSTAECGKVPVQVWQCGRYIHGGARIP